MRVTSDDMRSVRSLAVILIVHLVVIVLWQVLVDAFHVPRFILPSPLATLATLESANYAWMSNVAVTAAEILGGFIASERGLGYLMIQVQSSLDTPAMLMAVVLLTLLGVGLYGLVLGLERLFVVRDVRLQ